MTTQPELPDGGAAPRRPLVRLAAVAGTRADLDFDAFVRRYESRLRRLVLRRLGDAGESEEITQETLLRAYQHRASFASEDELMAWSTVVAQRLVIDRIRVRGRSVAVAEVPETARLGRDTADIVVARHEARAALEALEAIPTRQAAILWAREVEGLHYDDIAERFGITEPAVRSLLHRGRRALRKEFHDRTGMIPLAGLAPFAPWLLALKAAGRVRRAAKATVGNPTAVVGALAFVGITALTIAPWRGGSPGARPGADRLPRSGRGIDRVASAPARAGGAATVAADVSRRRVVPQPQPPQGDRPLHLVDVCPGGVDGSVDPGCPGFYRTRRPDGITIWVGPPLPSNPTGIRRVGVNVGDTGTPYEDCRYVPTTHLTTCTTDDGGKAPSEDGAATPTEMPPTQGVDR